MISPGDLLVLVGVLAIVGVFLKVLHSFISEAEQQENETLTRPLRPEENRIEEPPGVPRP